MLKVKNLKWYCDKLKIKLQVSTLQNKYKVVTKTIYIKHGKV